eukprot:3770543-Prymnesium_polylepis.2
MARITVMTGAKPVRPLHHSVRMAARPTPVEVLGGREHQSWRIWCLSANAVESQIRSFRQTANQATSVFY